MNSLKGALSPRELQKALTPRAVPEQSLKKETGFTVTKAEVTKPVDQNPFIETVKTVESVSTNHNFKQIPNPFNNNSIINKEELKNSFGNIPNQSEKARLNEDSFCCYETESLSKENFDCFKQNTAGNMFTQSSITQSKTKEDERKTKEPSSRRMTLNVTSQGELLKDITNTYISVHESFQKPNNQNKNNDNACEQSNEGVINYPVLQDSEKKNPLEMDDFDD